MGKLIYSKVTKEGKYYLITIYIVGNKGDGWGSINASAWDADDVGLQLEEDIIKIDNHEVKNETMSTMLSMVQEQACRGNASCNL